MQQLLTFVLDLIFPPRNSALTLRSTTPADLANRYRPGSAGDIIYLTQYRDPVISAAITENKFHHNQHARQLLATALETWLASHPASNLVCVPIPLGRERQRARGYNQVIGVLEATATPTTTVTALARTRETAPQTTLAKSARIQNVQRAFAVTPEISRIPERSTVVLIDDVISTGATMKAARAELAPHLPAGCTLICLALAH